MLEYIDPMIISIIKEKREEGTLGLTAGFLIAFGMALGALAIYDHVKQTNTIRSKKKTR